MHENQGLKFKFKGYNDKLDRFISEFFQILKEMASSGIQPDQHYLVQNAIEKIGKEYLNKNVEIDTRTTNNRLLLLCEDQYHGDLLASVLEGSKDEVRTMLIGDFANSEILLKIKFTKMLVVGNMTPDDAVQIGR